MKPFLKNHIKSCTSWQNCPKEEKKHSLSIALKTHTKFKLEIFPLLKELFQLNLKSCKCSVSNDIISHRHKTSLPDRVMIQTDIKYKHQMFLHTYDVTIHQHKLHRVEQLCVHMCRFSHLNMNTIKNGQKSKKSTKNYS